MDALKMYYNALEIANENGITTELTPNYLKRRLSELKKI